MIQSMTGYGKAEYNFSDHKTIVEIRSLNSKQLDLTLKTSPLFRDKEAEIRSLLAPQLERGKVDVAVYSVTGDGLSVTGLTPVNWDAAEAYAAQYKARFGDVPPEVMASILRFPDVFTSSVNRCLCREIMFPQRAITIC